MRKRWPGFDPVPRDSSARAAESIQTKANQFVFVFFGWQQRLCTSDLRLTVSTFPSAQHQSCCDRILAVTGLCGGLFGAASTLAASKRASHFANSSHFLCKCAVPELLTVTLAGPSPALLNRLQGGGQARLSAALGARCVDKPGGLEAQLKLGQRGLASSVRWWEIPRVLHCCRPQRHEKERGGRQRKRRTGGGGERWEVLVAPRRASVTLKTGAWGQEAQWWKGGRK